MCVSHIHSLFHYRSLSLWLSLFPSLSLFDTRACMRAHTHTQNNNRCTDIQVKKRCNACTICHDLISDKTCRHRCMFCPLGYGHKTQLNYWLQRDTTQLFLMNACMYVHEQGKKQQQSLIVFTCKTTESYCGRVKLSWSCTYSAFTFGVLTFGAHTLSVHPFLVHLHFVHQLLMSKFGDPDELNWFHTDSGTKQSIKEDYCEKLFFLRSL